MRRALVPLVGLVLAASCRSSGGSPPPRTACLSSRAGEVVPMFHGDRARLGWSDAQPDLAPERVARGMRLAFASEPFPSLERGGVVQPGRAYASPLYADDVPVRRGAATGARVSLALVATSNGDVLAIAAADASCAEGPLAAGTTVWRTRLVNADVVPDLDGRSRTEPKVSGVALGTLATPVLDGTTLYVTAMDAEEARFVWKVFALDVTTGDVLPGWPVVLDPAAVQAANANGPARFDDDARVVSQRSALALSGDRLYVSTGGYWDEAVGWLVAIDTRSAKIVRSFAGAPDEARIEGQLVRHANAGMWAPGGPAVDASGRVLVTTGNSPEKSGPAKGMWGNSLLRFGPDLALDATYTPWDYCALDARDVDIAGSSALVLPDGRIVLGGKSGVVYLVAEDRLVRAPSRPPCATSWEDAAKDASQLPPDPAEPYCEGFASEDPCRAPVPGTRCVRGPLQVYGPPGDRADVDFAKMRTTPAYFRDASGGEHLFVSGSTKAARCDASVVPPSVVRLGVRSDHLAVEAKDAEIAFVNPGSPVVTSAGGQGPVVWIVDANAKRTAPLLDPATPTPVLHAVDGTTMKPLWRSPPLGPSGKYTTPAVAHGTVYVATDRLQAFAPAP